MERLTQKSTAYKVPAAEAAGQKYWFIKPRCYRRMKKFSRLCILCLVDLLVFVFCAQWIFSILGILCLVSISWYVLHSVPLWIFVSFYSASSESSCLCILCLVNLLKTLVQMTHVRDTDLLLGLCKMKCRTTAYLKVLPDPFPLYFGFLSRNVFHYFKFN